MASEGRPESVPERIKLTKTSVENLPAWGREYVVWSADERGLGVRVSKHGVKSYCFLGRVKGALKRVNLGRTDERHLKDVLEDVRKIRAGADDTSAVAFGARGIRVKEAFDRFLLAPTKRGKVKAEKTLIGYRSDYKVHIGPALGERYVSSIVHADVEKLITGIVEAGHPTMAGGIGRSVKAFLGFCRRNGWHKGDAPWNGVVFPDPQTRTRYLSKDEVPKFSAGIDKANINVYVATAFRVMLFTGMRLNECLRLRWDMINFDAGVIAIPHAKGKPRFVLLNEQARTALASLPRLEGNPHVFPGHKKGKHLVDVRRPFEKVLKAAGISDLRRHDLRRTLGSLALQAGAPMEEVAGMLGHSSISVTERAYAFLGDQRLAAASNRTGKLIEGLMQAALPETVVPLKKKART